MKITSKKSKNQFKKITVSTVINNQDDLERLRNFTAANMSIPRAFIRTSCSNDEDRDYEFVKDLLDGINKSLYM